MQGFQSFLAPAKVNLFLHIVGRRDDGYHLLQSVFRLIALYDTVHIKIRHDGLITRARGIPGVPADQDLCIRAARLLQQHSGCKLGADIAVDKRIPMGGGLGGGSSDAATVLLALNTLWDLKLDRQTLMALGLKLGADVPFFIFGTSAWVEGIGEQIQPVALNPCHYIVLTPQVHVPTAEIFSAEELTRNTIPTTIAAFSRVLSGLPAETGTGVEQKGLLHEHDLLNERLQFHNDLEAVVCKRYPAVLSCMTWLNEQSTRLNEQNQPGVAVARMSGSGASVFVEVADEELASKLAAKVPRQLDGVPVFAYIARGLDQHPLSAVNLV